MYRSGSAWKLLGCGPTGAGQIHWDMRLRLGGRMSRQMTEGVLASTPQALLGLSKTAPAYIAIYARSQRLPAARVDGYNITRAATFILLRR